MTAALLLPLVVVGALNGTKVFYNGLEGVQNYRIPAIVQADQALVAFAEARAGGDSSNDRAHQCRTLCCPYACAGSPWLTYLFVKR